MTTETIDAICSLLAIAMAIIAIILANIAGRIAKDSRASRLAELRASRSSSFDWSQIVTKPERVASRHSPVANRNLTSGSPIELNSDQKPSLVKNSCGIKNP